MTTRDEVNEVNEVASDGSRVGVVMASETAGFADPGLVVDERLEEMALAV